MGYESAPATEMLATHCAACGRSLIDAVSVEIGMGPDCRSKHGYNATMKGLDEGARAEANALVHRVALNQYSLASVNAAIRLRELGFSTLAARIQARIVTVTITVNSENRYVVKTPYNPNAVEAMHQISGRWDAETKANTFPTCARALLLEILTRFFRGHVAIGPKGPFIL